MKILVICQYYFPEPFRITDICEELVQRGNEVTVVTGEPNYSEGYIYKGYENHRHTDVHRCPIVPRKTGNIYRFLNQIDWLIRETGKINGLWYTKIIQFIKEKGKNENSICWLRNECG